jgi:hypothetical protein
VPRQIMDGAEEDEPTGDLFENSSLELYHVGRPGLSIAYHARNNDLTTCDGMVVTHLSSYRLRTGIRRNVAV